MFKNHYLSLLVKIYVLVALSTDTLHNNDKNENFIYLSPYNDTIDRDTLKVIPE